ncbi:hypothetical protein AHF37_10166 [Paragonimus kellicotti]|nr:hypothetical protein AHF37_10166 [Paragonimus kellicotti]
MLEALPFATVELQHSWRQSDDPDLARLLAAAREGKCPEWMQQLLRSRCVPSEELPENKSSLVPTRLCTHRNDADAWNLRMLNTLQVQSGSRGANILESTEHTESYDENSPTVVSISVNLVEDARLRGINGQAEFAFESSCWKRCRFATVELQHSWRQSDDPDLARLLAAAREGKCPEWMQQLLRSRCVPSEQLPENKSSLVPTRLCTHRNDADAWNLRMLNTLQGTLENQIMGRILATEIVLVVQYLWISI